MTKDEIKVNFDALATRYHKKLASEVRGILYNLKSTWNWTNADLAYFLDTNENRIEDILSEYWDGRMSAKTFVRINLLTMGKFNMPGCEMSYKDTESMKGIISSFQETKVPPRTREEKIQDVLDLFGVTDDTSLDRLISAIVDVRKAINKVDSDILKEEDNHCNCDEGSIKATCYDSKTMDKPKTFSINLSEYKPDDIKKFVDDFANFTANLFTKNNK